LKNDNNMRQPIPNFANEDEEREFWANHDPADYLDWAEAKPVVFSKLKPTVHSSRLAYPAEQAADFTKQVFQMAAEKDNS
jgi:hypothetical protein